MRSIALTEHFTKVHEGKKEFTCLICGADYQEEIHLQKHIAAVHENGGNSQGRDKYFSFSNLKYYHWSALRLFIIDYT